MSEVVQEIASVHNATPLQIMLAWTMREEDIISIPKASSREHVIENAAAGGYLSKDEIWKLDEAFPIPSWKVPLDMI